MKRKKTGTAAQAQLNASWQRTATYQRSYFDRGSVGTGDNEEFDVDDSVWWDLQESKNPHQKDGIRPNRLFAVLLQRETDADFIGDFRLNVDAGTWQNIREEWKFKTGQTISDDPVNFHPGRPPQGVHEGIDPNNLGEWAVGECLAKLTEISGLEPLGPPEAVRNWRERCASCENKYIQRPVLSYIGFLNIMLLKGLFWIRKLLRRTAPQMSFHEFQGGGQSIGW